MQRIPGRRTPDAVAFHAHLPRSRSWLALVIPILMLGSAAAVRAAIQADQPSGISVGASGLSPDQLKAGAAGRLERAVARGGTGYSFEIAQTSTITARPDGPKIDIPDPNDPHKSLGLADTYLFYSLIERGIVKPDGFWSELRVGPQPGEKPDFENAELRRSALMKDGVGWRNDRDGWYQADVLPGIGLDPETAALLPRLLRNASQPVATHGQAVKGLVLATIAAKGTEADVPGLVAARGAKYTKLTAPIDFSFDDQGRLAQIHAVALNTTMTDFDLVVDTTIDLSYEDPGPLPDPDPTWQPTSAPQE